MGLKFCSKCKSILKYVQEDDGMYLFCARCENKEPVKDAPNSFFPQRPTPAKNYFALLRQLSKVENANK